MGCCDCLFKSIKGCCDCISKALLMSLNGFFMVQGLALTVGMAIALVMLDAIVKDGDGVDGAEELGFITSVKNIVITVLCFGATIVCVSFLGCCGACCKNKCMLLTYAVLLMALIVGQIVLVVMAANYRDSVEDGIKDDWRIELRKYNASDYPRIAIDEIQEQFECCGVTTFEDWIHNPYLSPNSSVPDSCCTNVTQGCGYGYFRNPNHHPINEEGCYDLVRDDVMFYFKFVWFFILGVIGIQALLVISACCLSWKEKKQNKKKKSTRVDKVQIIFEGK